MKKQILLLALLFMITISSNSLAQPIILSENFEDGDFTQNPEWVGDLDDWIIVNEDGNNRLRLNGAGAGVSHLSTQSTSAYGSWSFFVRLDGFATSDNNRAHVFLMSDRADTESEVNGYAVRVGESGSNKFFRIVRFDNGVSGASRVIVTGATLIEQNIGYQVRVTRSSDGEWSLFVSEGYGSEPQPEGTPAIDTTYESSDYFGVRATYTATRRENFFFDDFVITGESTAVSDITVLDAQTLDVRFSNAIDETSVVPSAFVVNEGIGSPSTTELQQNDTVRISFSNPIPVGNYELTVSGIEDANGSEVPSQTLPFSITSLGTFSLLTPEDGAVMTTSEGSEDPITITWESSNGAESYTWLAIEPDGFFDTPLLSIPSNDGGLSTTLTLTSGQLDTELNSLGVEQGGQISLLWTVEATSESESRFANNPFSLTLVRADADDGDVPLTGDVVINEFWYDNPNDLAQYVEIYNRTENKTFNLRDWGLANSSGSPAIITPDNIILTPGEYAVLTIDSSGLFTRFGDRNYIEMPGFQQLARTTPGQIRLISRDDQTIDVFQYLPTEWGGEGVALERKSAFAISYASDNWTDSTNPLGGTPGQVNTAQPNPNPLVVTDVTLRNTTSINVIFDRHVDRSTAEDAGNYSLSGGLDISLAEKIGNRIIRLTLASSLTFDTNYTLTVAGIESIFGVFMPVQTIDFSFEEPDEIIVLMDDFEDGDFTQNPEWFGNRENFSIAPFNGNNRLVLDAPGAGISFLSTASIANYGSWEFMINPKYATSDNNRAHVFLISDQSNLTENVNGYAVRVGESGSNKFFRIVRFDAGVSAQILVTGTTLLEANKDYQVRVTRNAEGEWRLFVSEGYGSEPMEEGTPIIDNTHATAAWFGVRPLYTSTRLDLISLDDVRVTKLPLFLANVQVVDSQNFDIIFSEGVNPASVNTQSFSINNDIGEPNSFTVNGNSVRITYSTPLAGGTYEISVSGIRDLAGGLMSPKTIEFNLVNQPESGDLVVNEFYYSTPPEFAQYVELFNTTSDKLFNLKDWRIQDNTTTTRLLSTDDFFLAPGDFVVLTSNSEGLTQQFGDQNYLILSNFPSLNRSTADQIKIYRDDDTLVDSLRYEPSSWGGSSEALERRSISAPSFLAENWSPSTAPNGGTPGESNTAEPDSDPIEIASVSPVDATTISVIFNRMAEPNSAQNVNNYQLGQIPIESVSLIQANQVLLSLSAAMQTNTEYSLTISGIETIFGVVMSTTNVSFTFLEFQEPDFNDIIVNEFLYRQVTGEIPRFIELYNRSNKNIDIKGWQLGRSSAIILLTSSSENIPLKPGEYVVISDDPSLLGVPAEQSLQVPSMLALSQNGDAVFIRDSNGSLIDSLRYSPNWGGSPAGFSLERLDPNGASNDRSNWQTSPDGFSAGGENVSFTPDTAPPRVIFSKRDSEGLIEVRFNEFIQPTDNTVFQLGGITLSVASFNSFAANRILLQGGGQTNLQTGAGDELITIRNITDVPGNEATELTIPIAQTIQQGDVVVNEIMYQPITGRYNDFPDQSEYVEFYNRQNYAIDLEGFRIHDQPDRDGNVSSILPVSSESAWIPANGFVVLYPDNAVAFSNSRISQFFGIESGDFFFRAERTTLSLSTQGGAVYLATESGLIVDSVLYQPDWHNPNLVDVRGIALERISPSGISNDSANWGSSVVIEGGTPGNQNSLFASPEQFPDSEDFVVEPNPFSPDGDGVDDNLFINYKLNEADYLVRVRIFDRYGRLIKVLADGIPAGFEGSLIWDGRRDNGMENRVGFYIIHFEAFNSASGKNKTFKKTVVLARKL